MKIKGLLLLWLVFICSFLSGCGNMGPPLEIIVSPEALEKAVHLRMEKLNSLGIEGTDALAEREVIEQLEMLPPDYLKSMQMPDIDSTILSHLGWGTYDYDMGNWTASSSQVYVFDVEVFDISHMYTNFLEGISSIMEGEAVITDIIEECEFNEDGSGSQTIRFLWNGNPYQFSAKVNYDWFDTDVIYFINAVLQKEGYDKKLWAASDGYQNCILFYNTEEWAERYSKIMGYELDGGSGFHL